VHYIPQQGMSLISVDKAISDQGFDSPDFKNLTWKADDDTCTLKILKTNSTFMLDAASVNDYDILVIDGLRAEFTGNIDN
jgi:hypothetical protein